MDQAATTLNRLLKERPARISPPGMPRVPARVTERNEMPFTISEITPVRMLKRRVCALEEMRRRGND